MHVLREEYWNAIITNDATYDTVFFYGVQSTQIFCRPSCKSPNPNKRNVHIFQTAEQAMQLGFRPCKRCKPLNPQTPEEEWITSIKMYIDQHYMKEITLQQLAQVSHSSPYHLQRTFKRRTGMSPSMYVQRIRLLHAKELLDATSLKIADIGQLVGIQNTAYFCTLFKEKVGLTPDQYRKQEEKQNI